MATRRYSINPGLNEYQVTEAVGAATVTNFIELTVDLANTDITDSNTTTGTRSLTREEVLEGIDKIKNYILRGNWPPA